MTLHAHPLIRHRREEERLERLAIAALTRRVRWNPGQTAAELNRSVNGTTLGIGATLRRLDLLEARGIVVRRGDGWHPGPNFHVPVPATTPVEPSTPEPVQVLKPAPAPTVEVPEVLPEVLPDITRAVLETIRKRPGLYTVGSLSEAFGVAESTMRKRVGLLRASGVVSEYGRDIMPLRALIVAPISHVTEQRAAPVYRVIATLTRPATREEVSQASGVNASDVTRIVAALRRWRCVSEAGSLWPMG